MLTNYEPCDCQGCTDVRVQARLLDLEAELLWLRALYESARQVNRMWEQTARYAINRLGGEDATQALTAYSDHS